MNKAGNFNETVRLIYEHPIATCFIVSATLGGIAKVIRAIKWNGEEESNADALEEIFDICFEGLINE